MARVCGRARMIVPACPGCPLWAGAGRGWRSSWPSSRCRDRRPLRTPGLVPRSSATGNPTLSAPPVRPGAEPRRRRGPQVSGRLRERRSGFVHTRSGGQPRAQGRARMSRWPTRTSKDPSPMRRSFRSAQSRRAWLSRGRISRGRRLPPVHQAPGERRVAGSEAPRARSRPCLVARAAQELERGGPRHPGREPGRVPCRGVDARSPASRTVRVERVPDPDGSFPHRRPDTRGSRGPGASRSPRRR